MTPKLLIKSAFLAFAAFGLPAQLAAQSAEEVKTDVLSALSTPLPITVIGPLLTRDVAVTEEGDGFRATLEETTLMGLFPFGDVSIKLVPLDDDTYRVSDLQFPQNLDFPGLAKIDFTGMTLDGTWSAKDRSYTALNAELTELRVMPGQGDQGVLQLGRLAFDVQKEPDDTDTESRFNITLGDILVKDIGGPDITIGEAQALLSANGERPVDLYSLLREIMMVAGMRDGGVGLQTLGQSLLGNTYGTVTLDINASDLKVTSPFTSEDRYFQANGLQAQLNMRDISPRDWGMAELSVRLDQVTNERMLDSGTFGVENAVVRLRGAELPVADMFEAIVLMNAGYPAQPVSVTDLLDGFLEFGALELASEGKGLNVEVRDLEVVEGELVEETAFATSFDAWNTQLLLDGFNKNQGAFTTVAMLGAGSFVPGPNFDQDDLRHIKAWFPTDLKYGARVSNLNEGFLKQLFKDVLIQDMQAPVELMMPIMLYASASAFDVLIEGNRYQTDLFAVEQTGQYRMFPAKFMSIAPFEGRFDLRMTGFDALVGYLEEIRIEEAGREYGDEEVLSMIKSVLTVLRNLGKQSDDGSVLWQIEKQDVNQPEVMVNDTTFYYPDMSQLLPMALLGIAF